jgi:hypothetical protein
MKQWLTDLAGRGEIRQRFLISISSSKAALCSRRYPFAQAAVAIFWEIVLANPAIVSIETDINGLVAGGTKRRPIVFIGGLKTVCLTSRTDAGRERSGQASPTASRATEHLTTARGETGAGMEFTTIAVAILSSATPAAANDICSGGNRAERRVTCVVDGDTIWQVAARAQVFRSALHS